jgi:hypothetical protein
MGSSPREHTAILSILPSCLSSRPSRLRVRHSLPRTFFGSREDAKGNRAGIFAWGCTHAFLDPGGDARRRMEGQLAQRG